MNSSLKTTLATAAFAALALAPFVAAADDAAGAAAAVTTSAEVSAPGVSAGAQANVSVKLSARAATAKGKADQEIDRRSQNLTTVSARIAEMKNLSDTDKASIATTVENNIQALAQLKAKIDADSDTETLRTDIKSVTGSYRVYALLLPQVRIVAAADRIVTLATEMQSLSAKLQARIAAAQSSGADMSAATTALTDFDAKVSDAGAQAQAAVTEIANLTPDGGDKTKMEANTKALQDARAKVVAGQKDLIAARADAKIIVEAVKGKPVAVQASGSAEASSTEAQ